MDARGRMHIITEHRICADTQNKERDRCTFLYIGFFCPINKNHRGKTKTKISGKSDFAGRFTLEKALHIIHNKGKHSR